MNGRKTFIVAALLMISSGLSMIYDLPVRYSVPGLGIFIALGLISLRYGVNASWDGAYKVYVDKSDKNKIKSIKRPKGE